MQQTSDGEKNFLNVDLDLTFTVEIEPLVRELGELVTELNRTESFVSFELATGWPGPRSTDEALAGFATLVRGLSPKAREVWDRLARRTMNVGVEGPPDRHPLRFAVSRVSIALLVELGADLVFTVYQPEE
ncbi:MAG TPA: hypothetical protein VFD38_06345 [Myxococcaceae bacterium]|nr:hypothetical protein [Myxococcaceae bacterium]